MKEIKSEIEIKENKYKDPAKNIEKNTEDILKINNKFKDIEKYKEENNIEINTKEIIKNENITKEKEKDDEININKIKELNDKYEELKRNIKNNLYTNKINYKFKKEPQSLKFKLNITETNNSSGWNDIFEIFISHKDNKEYLVSPNTYTKNLDIFRLSDNKIIKNLEGHESDISTIRYFINKNSYNFDEYLITADKDKKIIIWDITDTILNYKIKYKIDTKYENTIYSCLLIFPHNNDDDNFIITSTKHKSNDNEKSSTKIYSLNNGDLIKYINNSNSEYIYYLLSWYNKKNNKYYIIQFSYKKIIINNLIEDELYSELKHEKEKSEDFCGFIYEKENKDYLCSSSYNGFINIWDLYNKKLFKVIKINKSELGYMTEWNNKYIIVADLKTNSFKIIDLEDNNKIYDINGQHTDLLICVKKIYHPLYGESLLSASKDKTIKLWTI